MLNFERYIKHKKPGRIKYFSIPYIGKSSGIIRNFLQSLDSNICISFGRYNTSKENFFTKIKDKNPLDQNSGVVYSVPCLGCPKVYVGETSQYLKSRISQHKHDVKSRRTSTALACHTLDMGHQFDFDNVCVVGREDNGSKRKILEVINIVKNIERTVNYKTDTNNLASVYMSIINDKYSIAHRL